MAARKASRQLLQIFVPEGPRMATAVPVDLQDKWVTRLLETCASLFGGATAHARGIGVWKEADAPGAPIHWDRVTVIECWLPADVAAGDTRLVAVVNLLSEMRRELHQKAVGCILNGEWLPLEGDDDGKP